MESPHFSGSRGNLFVLQSWFLDGTTSPWATFRNTHEGNTVTPPTSNFLFFQVSHLRLVCFLSQPFKKTRTYFSSRPSPAKFVGFAAHFMFTERMFLQNFSHSAIGVFPRGISNHALCSVFCIYYSKEHFLLVYIVVFCCYPSLSTYVCLFRLFLSLKRVIFLLR